MRWTICSILLCATIAAVAQETKEEAARPDLGWLAGSWRAEGADGVVWEEHWLPPRGETMVGVTRFVKEGKTQLYEQSVMEPGVNGPTLRIRHFSMGLVPWKSEADGPESWRFKSAGKSEIVFEEPDRKDLCRVIYRREGDILTVRLEGTDRLIAEFPSRKAD